MKILFARLQPSQHPANIPCDNPQNIFENIWKYLKIFFTRLLPPPNPANIPCGDPQKNIGNMKIFENSVYQAASTPISSTHTWWWSSKNIWKYCLSECIHPNIQQTYLLLILRKYLKIYENIVCQAASTQTSCKHTWYGGMFAMTTAGKHIHILETKKEYEYHAKWNVLRDAPISKKCSFF